MSALITELKSDHIRIIEMLDKVRQMGIGTDEGQKLLLSAKGFLVAHLTKEDKHLYPVLRKIAESDKGVERLLNTYAKDMEQISGAASAFFARYANGGDRVGFAIDVGKLFASLTQRVKKEEAFLYTKYEENELA